MARKSAVDKMYEELAKTGHKSNLRLTIKVMDGRETRFYYDRGVRQIDDPHNKLSMLNLDYDSNPRFLEDFVTVYGVKNVSIHEFGKYQEHKDLVKTILE